MNTTKLLESINPIESMTIADKVKYFRLKKGLTQVQLSKLSGIAQSNIASCETGNRPIGLQVAKKLAQALEVDYKSLI